MPGPERIRFAIDSGMRQIVELECETLFEGAHVSCEDTASRGTCLAVEV